MMDIFQPKHNSEGHTCSTVHGDECRSPCIGDVDNLAIQTSKGDVHLQKPVNERQKSSFRTGSRKRQFKSPREGDNDDDNHETLAMIRQQLYGPGGPYENMRVNQTDSESRCSKTSLGNLKRCRDDHEDEEETAFSQQPAKKARLGSSESRLVALFWHLRIMSNLKPVNGRQKSSFRTGSRKRQFKSPREGDNDDDNHETIAMIRQQLYGPGGPYENMRVNQTDSESRYSNTSLAKRKRCRDDHEDEEETGFSQQPAKKDRLGSSDVKHLALSGHYVDKTNMESVNRLPKSRFRTGSRKVHFKLPHEGDNKTRLKICPQQYGPVGPYENLIVNQVDPSDLASSSFHQQATTNRNSSLYSLSSGASGSNLVGTSTNESTSGPKSIQTKLQQDTGCNTNSD
ncbi:uncharacterized protein LOC108256825 [Ictalurus punctatus]|uniref:Uncharacterized protein LOC108256825 n=1 Tax=Ictalurus punctatus TaxID=7998 RepID=A0A2D0PWN0_ICTPU|nr:uncharacterized protein LOC108256825 [Ictalurus punctatus]